MTDMSFMSQLGTLFRPVVEVFRNRAEEGNSIEKHH